LLWRRGATWRIAHISNKHGAALARPVLGVQFVLLAAVLIFIARPSTNPHG
jgi:hypothetical protein